MKWFFGVIWRAIYRTVAPFFQLAGGLLLWAVLIGVFFFAVINLRHRTDNFYVVFGGGLAASMLVYYLLQGLLSGRGGDGHVRGTRRISFKDAQKRAKKLLSSSRERALLPWGGLQLPQGLAPAGFLAMGTPGSGKTITIDLLLKSVLVGRSRVRDSRALIFDAKTDAFMRLRNMGIPEERICLLSPFDSRGRSWNIARDIQRPEAFPEFAATLFPQEKTQEPFFDNATRDLLIGVLLSFHHCWPIKLRPWSLRDVYLAMSHKPWLLHVLGWYPGANTRRIEQYFSEPKTANNIMASISAKLHPYEAIAAYWYSAEQAGRTFSLEEWKNSDSIVVLPHSHGAAETLRAINQAFFKRFVQVVLDLPSSDERRVWVVLDELPKAGRLPLLDELIVKGRDRGACVIAGIQDINGMRAVYGRELTEEIVTILGHKVFFRLMGEDSAKWAEGIFGRAEVLQVTTSQGESVSGARATRTWTVTWAPVVKPIVLASEFQALDLPKGKQIDGFYATSGIGAYRWARPFKEVRKELKRQTDKDAAQNLVQWPAERGFMQTWSPAELAALSLPSPDTAVEVKRPGKSTTPAAPVPPTQAQQPPEAVSVPKKTGDALRDAQEAVRRAEQLLADIKAQQLANPRSTSPLDRFTAPLVELANTKPKPNDDEAPRAGGKTDDEAWDDFVRDWKLYGLPPEDLPKRPGEARDEPEDASPPDAEKDDQEPLDYR